MSRQEKIIELISTMEIGTQEELCAVLNDLGYKTTQATISRDIKSMRLRKVPTQSGQKYALPAVKETEKEKYLRIFSDALIRLDQASNLVVIKTIPGMAMAAAAAIDELNLDQIVGSIAGDDTIMCACRSDSDAALLIHNLEMLIKDI